MPKNEPTKKELKAKIQEQEQLLVESGIKKPDTLISQIEEIEDEYKEKISKLIQECEKKTGRSLHLSHLDWVTLFNFSNYSLKD